ncbi:hypothetical protein Tco_1407681 [Tanacetum coccineum]
MANLEFCDKHNMVAYLKKPSGSEGFQEIVDFLNGSHIRYALTKNPTIYVSLIEKFWQTATVRTVDNGEQEITATVDGKEFTVTEASVRRHLQLADVDGISVLPTTEFFDQLLLMGNMKRGFSGEHTPLFPSMLAIQAEEGEGSGHPSEPQPPPSTAQPTNEEPIPNVVSSSHQKTQTPRQALNKVTELPQTSEPIPNVLDEAVYKEWDDKVERATTTAARLDAEHASGGSPRCQEAIGGSIAQTRSERVPTPPRDSPLPRVHTLGSDEGSMTLQELTVLCTTLSKKVESLEADLKQTKQVYGAAYTKLIMKVKKLEKTVKISHSRRRAKIVVSDDEEDSEDSFKQGRMIEEVDQDEGVTLVTYTQGEDQLEDQLGVLSAAKVLADAAKINVYTYTRRRAVSTGSGGISTAGASMPVSTAGMVMYFPSIQTLITSIGFALGIDAMLGFVLEANFSEDVFETEDIQDDEQNTFISIRSSLLSILTLSDETLAIPLDEIQIGDKLQFIEEPVEIIDREVKRLKQSCIPIVKVRWNSRRGPEFAWEREDQMQKKYHHFFANSAPVADVMS